MCGDYSIECVKLFVNELNISTKRHPLLYLTKIWL